jgi:hypothetical protein
MGPGLRRDLPILRGGEHAVEAQRIRQSLEFAQAATGEAPARAGDEIAHGCIASVT